VVGLVFFLPTGGRDARRRRSLFFFFSPPPGWSGPPPPSRDREEEMVLAWAPSPLSGPTIEERRRGSLPFPPLLFPAAAYALITSGKKMAGRPFPFPCTGPCGLPPSPLALVALAGREGELRRVMILYFLSRRVTRISPFSFHSQRPPFFPLFVHAFFIEVDAELPAAVLLVPFLFLITMWNSNNRLRFPFSISVPTVNVEWESLFLERADGPGISFFFPLRELGMPHPPFIGAWKIGL